MRAETCSVLATILSPGVGDQGPPEGVPRIRDGKENSPPSQDEGIEVHAREGEHKVPKAGTQPVDLRTGRPVGVEEERQRRHR